MCYMYTYTYTYMYMYGTCKYVKCIPSFFGASMRGIGFTSAGFTLTIFLTPPPPPPPPGTREEEEEGEEEAGGPMLLMAFWSSLVVPPVDGFGLHAFSTHTYTEVEITAGRSLDIFRPFSWYLTNYIAGRGK